jgi:hypothetical protein
MRRIQFIELHDQPWFPSSIRNKVTDALQFGFNLVNVYAPIAPLLEGALNSAKIRPIAEQPIADQPVVYQPIVDHPVVDLCSGGGGPWFDLYRKLPGTQRGDLPALRIWLTDRYPNLGACAVVRHGSENEISFYPGSVDATKVPEELKGFRTMFTSFHHFSPEDARAVLQNAVDAGEGIGIFEVTRRTPATIILMLFWVLLVVICTPWILPFHWSRLFWTFLVPIVPLVLLFDGVVSCLRTYRPGELREMVAELSPSPYEWKIGELAGGPVPITFLIGFPGLVKP